MWSMSIQVHISDQMSDKEIIQKVKVTQDYKKHTIIHISVYKNHS